MKLDLSQYKKAVESMEQAISFSSKLIKGDANTPEEKFYRSGVIQNFEFTFEFSWKMMQRTLKEHFGNNDNLSRKELFRVAMKQELIENAEDWFKYQDARNITSHTYDEEKADVVFNIAKLFVKDAKYLLNKLEEIYS